jgi:hypothetical protein
MSTTFLEFSRPTTMPGGGVANSGENIGFDSVAQASFIASVLASGAAVAGSAPGAPTPPATQRVKFVATTMVNGSPPLYDAGEIATFLAPVSAQLIAQGLAISN